MWERGGPFLTTFVLKRETRSHTFQYMNLLPIPAVASTRKGSRVLQQRKYPKPKRRAECDAHALGLSRRNDHILTIRWSLSKYLITKRYEFIAIWSITCRIENLKYFTNRIGPSSFWGVAARVRRKKIAVPQQPWATDLGSQFWCIVGTAATILVVVWPKLVTVIVVGWDHFLNRSL